MSARALRASLFQTTKGYASESLRKINHGPTNPLERRLPSYWRVTFDHPPLNIFGPETIPQLNETIVALEPMSM